MNDLWSFSSMSKRLGLYTVRLPVGLIREHLAQEGKSFPRGGIQYLGRLIGWCTDTKIYVIIDFHSDHSPEPAIH
ncbi:hypothetical protein Trco_007954 [Trichoderma cornu-damae]|uniref:Glycoside hydrolase family 5 domain-containing protein n=1 Tax=Trichoderma cornu-damae TaxID=654480 RepID=A0A9P8QEZ7_9HYPO|nr:hypothetical protein Trco_007954 [Trichoderma cornu-damae]